MILHETDARLIWQLYCSKAVEAGVGDRVFIWEYLPGKREFIEAVSIVLSDRNERFVEHVRSHLRVAVPPEKPPAQKMSNDRQREEP